MVVQVSPLRVPGSANCSTENTSSFRCLIVGGGIGTITSVTVAF